MATRNLICLYLVHTNTGPVHVYTKPPVYHHSAYICSRSERGYIVGRHSAEYRVKHDFIKLNWFDHDFEYVFVDQVDSPQKVPIIRNAFLCYDVISVYMQRWIKHNRVSS